MARSGGERVEANEDVEVEVVGGLGGGCCFSSWWMGVVWKVCEEEGGVGKLRRGRK